MTLTILTFGPLLGALVATAIPTQNGRDERAIGLVALLFALAALGIAIYLVCAFDSSAAGLSWPVDEKWIPAFGVRYSLGIDGINLFLVLLTTGLWVAAIFSALLGKWERPRFFYSMMLLAETAVLGAFMAQDLILFVAFFDLMLVPFYFLIGAWGGANRRAATTKFVIYTLIGSLLMLVGAVATGVLNGAQNGELTFAISELAQTPLAEGSQRWIFVFFAVAFLVKMPAFPLHGWMPDAYRAAPIPVVVVLSAVLSKVAAYGFLRIVLPIYPDASVDFQEVVLVIAVISIIYGSIVAFTQNDARLVIGYSSVAQLGFITLGIFALRPEGANGAVLQMVNHGLVVAPLFFIVAVLAARCGSEDLRRMGGVAFRAPALAALFLIVTLATLAMPGSANFVGEFMILLALFQSKLALAVVASVGVALAAVYALRLYQRSMHNPLSAGTKSQDIGLSEAMLLVPLVAAIVALAIYPQVVLKRSDYSIQRTLNSSSKQASPDGLDLPQQNEATPR